MSDRDLGLEAPIDDETPGLDRLEAALNYSFRDRDLLERALVHSSAAAEEGCESNQRLEFLGDAVLDLAIGELIMLEHREAGEGDLTRMRASLVSANGIAGVAETLAIGRWLRLGKGEEKTGGRSKPNIIADAYEALLGAVFMDGGYECARAVIDGHFRHLIRRARPSGTDHKTDLQELTQQRFQIIPNYSVVAVSGPDHERLYEVELSLRGEVLSRAEGPSRKAAEQEAARLASIVLRSRDYE